MWFGKSDELVLFNAGRQSILGNIDVILNDVIQQAYIQAKYTDQVEVNDIITKTKIKYGLFDKS